MHVGPAHPLAVDGSEANIVPPGCCSSITDVDGKEPANARGTTGSPSNAVEGENEMMEDCAPPAVNATGFENWYGALAPLRTATR